MSGINISGVTYHPRKEHLFENLNLHIERHKITCLIGPNGSGKSTLLKLLARLVMPQSGTIYLDNIAINNYSRKAFAKKLAYLPQHCALPVSLTVSEYIALSRFCYQSWFSKLTKDDCEIIEEAIFMTDLKALANKPVASLSAGQQQRARIAFMLAQQVEYLLLDEPMTGLDLKQQRNIINLILRLKREASKTIILVLHDLHQAIEIADEIILLKEGKIAANGEPCKVICADNVLNVFGCSLPSLNHAGNVGT